MKIVTAGPRYLDIDAYGGIVAYAELLNLQGASALAVSTAPLNESVTPEIRSWHADFERSYRPSQEDTFILVDVSNPEQFETFVANDRIDEIIDHHPEGTIFWRRYEHVRAQIEFVGAACTLVYERWQATGLLDRISTTSARLLVAGILDNTLNFEAEVTTSRDRSAYQALLPYADLPESWAQKYFHDCQAAIVEDIENAVRNDIKALKFPSLEKPVTVGQLVVWDGREIIQKHRPVFQKVLAAVQPEWMMSVVSIAENKNYFVTSNADLQSFLTSVAGVSFVHDTAESNRLWLRKEIMKADLERQS